MQKELEQLRKEFNIRIDNILNNPKDFVAVDKPKFELNKWYHVTTEGFEGPYKWLCYLKSLEDDKLFGDVIDLDNNKYSTNENFCDLKVIISSRLATESEVSEHLIEEAKRRKYTADNFKCLTGNTVKLDPNPEYFYKSDSDLLFFGTKLNANHVYRNGKWAEIIPVEEKILIGGYEVEFLSMSVKIGCKIISKHSIKYLKDFMNDKGFKEVSFDGTPATLDQLNKILDKLK